MAWESNKGKVQTIRLQEKIYGRYYEQKHLDEGD